MVILGWTNRSGFIFVFESNFMIGLFERPLQDRCSWKVDTSLLSTINLYCYNNNNCYM
jgi:hypothetical protein